MTALRSLAAAAALLAVAACGEPAEPDPAPTARAGPPPLGAGELPLQAEDFPALASPDCVEVAQFYFEAIGGGEFERAALVWDDPVIDGARLAALYAGYTVPQVEWTEPFVEGAAGSLYCTVTGKLTDAGDPARPLLEGTLLLRRVNDVPGAAPDQLRWTLRSSTFIERMERSGAGSGSGDGA